jgi:hypothetical protein
LVNDSKEDDEQTCSDGGGEELDATTMQDNIEEGLEPNLDHVITNIQDEPISFTKLVVLIIAPTTVFIISFEHVQHVI